ncbi:MAG: translocation/assembly module TamB domain-containing protein [Mucilaginibacter polytrichastri]|nr:translocation/assembly module TamB domain-containing protein [Mucilaginibacter polytrichastri]
MLEDLYALDQQNDTLLHTPRLTVQISGFSPFSSIKERKLDFSEIRLDSGRFHLKKLRDSSTNLSFIINYFDSGDTTTSGRPWEIKFGKIIFNKLHLSYDNALSDAEEKGVVDFEHPDLREFSGVISGMNITDHLFKAQVDHLTFREKSGLHLRELTAAVTVDTNQIELQKLTLHTNRSKLGDYYRMKFRSFTDFRDYVHKVHMDVTMRPSHIDSRDIEFFAPEMRKVVFNYRLSGTASGTVDNIRSRNLDVRAGQATHVQGNFKLRGLPDINKTFLDLDFHHVATNKRDAQKIFADLTGDRRAFPEIADKFGNLSFNGEFTGFINDFVAYGEFKSSLGRFISDVNFKTDKAGTPSYSGTVRAFDFALGDLLDQKSLGRTSLTANISGSSFDYEKLREKLDLDVQYLDFNGYRYNKLAINGTFINRLFDGRISIKDRNLGLTLKGSVNLLPKLPQYRFTSTIRGARLKNLGFSKDTVNIDADFTTHFSGDDLNNIAGNINIRQARLSNDRHNYVIDSVLLAASGIGKNRSILIRSDILDGSLQGTVELNTLPSYFKTLVKKYIPSLQAKIVTPKPQNFRFDLHLKNLDPLTAFFMPELKIPEEGTLVAQFNSEEKIANLSGFIKTIEYNKIIFHDLILDQTTTDSLLSINAALSKIDLKDSLYIKNISITNQLARDSLDFNIKMSDKDASNQLDLYGLVAFARDTAASLQILPSDVIIEHEPWRLQDEVDIQFLQNGNIRIAGFDLSNKEQHVRLDGTIAKNAEEELKIVFDKFNLSSFNAITKPSGIMMSGQANGNVILHGLLGKPDFNAKLAIDTLTFNERAVGDVSLTAGLDPDDNDVNVDMNIRRQNIETLRLAGAYHLKNATDQLDFELDMNNAELIILEPVVSKLVSDLTGNMSSDLKITGTAQNPDINGSISLKNAGLTVNYLQTPFIINDDLSVKNSVIALDGLKLTDGKKGRATANGSVDLKNVSNPLINVTLNAQNLMALNTTIKDNSIYYGTAYATGQFKFNGPVDNMKIDIRAKTEDGTEFTLPLNNANTASDYDYITFVGKDSSSTVVKPKSFNGITLNFDLTIDEKSLVRIKTDYGELEGRGSANNLKLNINSLGDFEMFGDYLISGGKFEFTAKNFITKLFTVNQGGTIRWTGDPTNGNINLRAAYEVRTTTDELYTAAGLRSPQPGVNRLVRAELVLTESLLKPTIDFDFNFPNDPNIKDELSTYLNNVSNRNQQALSLIVRRKFAPGTGGDNISQEVLGTAGEAVSEFAFNKINNFISQANIKNLDLSIRSFNEASATLRAFNERLVVSGSLVNTQGNNNLLNANQSLFSSGFQNLTKDFEALYRLRKNGDLTARYSYRVFNNNFITLGDNLNVQYVNGLGLVYRKDFDTFGEYLRMIFSGKKGSRQNGSERNSQPATGGSGPRTNGNEDEEEFEPF